MPTDVPSLSYSVWFPREQFCLAQSLESPVWSWFVVVVARGWPLFVHSVVLGRSISSVMDGSKVVVL